MLVSLSIRDIVLIEKLDLGLGSGLNVLTGETGAGKSILLDSLGLALGARADRSLVRQGCDQSSVTASFDLPSDAAAFDFLKSQGIDVEDDLLIIRRQITTEGRSRAWINDQPVGQGILSSLGAFLVEIHGQHDDRGLLDPISHRRLLDMYMGQDSLLAEMSGSYIAYQELVAKIDQERRRLDSAKEDEEYLRHSLEELQSLSPIEGEERELSDRRALMMQGEKLNNELGGFIDDLAGRKGAEQVLRGVLRRMERIDDRARKHLEEAMQTLDRASLELSETVSLLEALAREMDFDPNELERSEERLFELRRIARKHDITCDDLPKLMAEIEQKLVALEQGDEHLNALETALRAAHEKMIEAAGALHTARTQAAQALDQGIMKELPPLKLEKAAFRTSVEMLPEEQWSEEGADRVSFEIKTNPGAPFGPLTKVASGGEFARVILALKVILAKSTSVGAMVFDEVDQGVGGATADAVGERLKRLAKDTQTLVVTHSPQVAACGDHHFQIEKGDDGTVTKTTVIELSLNERREEVARMLSGAEITNEARAAADKLLMVEQA